MGRLMLLLNLLVSVITVKGLKIDILGIKAKTCDMHSLDVICKVDGTELGTKELKIAQDNMTLARCKNRECSLVNNETYQAMFDGMVAKLSVMALKSTKNETTFSCGIEMNKAVMKLKIWGCAKPMIKWHEHPYVNLVLIIVVVVMIIVIVILGICICRLKEVCQGCFTVCEKKDPKKYNGRHHDVKINYKQTDVEADVKHSDGVPKTEEARAACAQYDGKEEASKLLKGYCEDRSGVEETFE